MMRDRLGASPLILGLGTSMTAAVIAAALISLFAIPDPRRGIA